MDSEEKDVRQFRQGKMAARLREEMGDILDKEENRVINAVMSKLSSGYEVSPQFAIQQWLALHSVRAFRRTLEQRERAGGRMAKHLTNPE